MPYANNGGVRIYFEVEGEGSPLVMQYPFTCSIQTWRDYKYVEELKSNFKLILIDARGHGLSDKPHDAASYTSEMRAKDILAVLDSLAVKKIHFLGYSMGGWEGFAMAKYASERLHSLIIGGRDPYKRDFHPLNEIVERLSEDVRLIAHGGNLDPGDIEMIKDNDIEALIASLIGIRDDPDFADILADIQIPCMIYVGDNDINYFEAKRAAAHLPDAEFVSLQGLDHLEAFLHSERILPYIKEFLGNVVENP